MKTLASICALLWIFTVLTYIPTVETAERTVRQQPINEQDEVKVPHLKIAADSPSVTDSEISSSAVHPDKPSNSGGTRSPELTRSKSKGNCYKGDLVCEKDKLGYEAIASLHAQMDDDHNGDIDLEESAEFLREELQYKKSHLTDHRSQTFHKNDTHITVDDLWMRWKLSEVHNWTVTQVCEWLIGEVELPYYVEAFKNNAVDGSTLPRLAVNNLNFVSNILGIKNLVHKQRLALKATDVVLFGSPKSRHNFLKDIVLMTALAIAAGGCWLAYLRNRKLEENMSKAMKDMEGLAKSEQALKELQERLTLEETEKKKHIKHKEQLEARIKREVSEARLEAMKLKQSRDQTENELGRMKELEHELERTKEALKTAHKELEVRRSLSPTAELQKWLQITYELELKAYNEKKAHAECQLHNAKESIERLRKKRQALFGSFRMAHSGYIDETEQIILSAKRALEEVKHDLTERQYRWQQVEMMCNFSVMSNPGLKALIQSTGHTDLYRLSHGGRLLDSVPSDLDDFDDYPPNYGAVLAAMQSNGYVIRRASRDSPLLACAPSISNLSSQSIAQAPSLSRGHHHGSSQHMLSSPTASEARRPSSNADHQEHFYDASSYKSGSESLPSAGGSCESTGAEGGQPSFGLYPEEGEVESSSSSSTGDNHIPNRQRPPLQRNQALRQQTDTLSVFSDDVTTAPRLQHTDAMRPRSNTNEAMNRQQRPHKFAQSPNKPPLSPSKLTSSPNPNLTINTQTNGSLSSTSPTNQVTRIQSQPLQPVQPNAAAVDEPEAIDERDLTVLPSATVVKRAATEDSILASQQRSASPALTEPSHPTGHTLPESAPPFLEKRPDLTNSNSDLNTSQDSINSTGKKKIKKRIKLLNVFRSNKQVTA